MSAKAGTVVCKGAYDFSITGQKYRITMPCLPWHTSKQKGGAPGEDPGKAVEIFSRWLNHGLPWKGGHCEGGRGGFSCWGWPVHSKSSVTSPASPCSGPTQHHHTQFRQGEFTGRRVKTSQLALSPSARDWELHGTLCPPEGSSGTEKFCCY